MKILILSHTRSGSTTLCKWLSKELDFQLDDTQYDNRTFDSVFDKENIIRKIVIEEYNPTNEIIKKFDKIICLSRDYIIDSSISFISANIKNNWHKEYQISKEWIEQNRDKIIKKAYEYENLKYYLKKNDGINITYEKIYIKKSDLYKILNYLNIENPKYLDMLNIDKKYRKDKNNFSYDFKRKNII